MEKIMIGIDSAGSCAGQAKTTHIMYFPPPLSEIGLQFKSFVPYLHVT